MIGERVAADPDPTEAFANFALVPRNLKAAYLLPFREAFRESPVISSLAK
jgi:hypothetical protein